MVMITDLFKRMSRTGQGASGRSSLGVADVAAAMMAAAPGSGGPVLSRPADVFTPGRPKMPTAGGVLWRAAELQRVLSALRDERSHVILFSERGRGKTSLANAVVDALRGSEIIVARYSCETFSSFDSIIRGLARDLPSALLANPDHARQEMGCEAILPSSDLRPVDVLTLVRLLSCGRLVFIIDEFDRIEDAATRTRFADTIKQVSDAGIDLCMMIIGASETLGEIIGQHPSIERSLLAMHLPLMSDSEIEALLLAGAAATGFTFADEILPRMVAACCGMPNMAQLVGLRVVQSAARRGDSLCGEDDLFDAVDHILLDMQPLIADQYAALTRDGTDEGALDVVQAIASAERDPHGAVMARPAGEDVSVGGRMLPRPLWSRLREMDVLHGREGEHGSVRFGQRSLLHYVLLQRMRRQHGGGAGEFRALAD